MNTSTAPQRATRTLRRQPRFGVPALGLLCALTLVTTAPGAIAHETTFQLNIKNHQFSPTTLEVPAGKKFKLEIHNEDATAEEFESHAMHREKHVPAGHSVTIHVGPLKPGSYPFAGEFHPKTAQGTIIAK